MAVGEFSERAGIKHHAIQQLIDNYKDRLDKFSTTEFASVVEGKRKAISDIHNRHKERLDKFSVVRKLSRSSGQEKEIFIYLHIVAFLSFLCYNVLVERIKS